MCLLAPRAAAWPGETFSLFKHIPAGHAAKREHRELPFLCQCRQRDVRKMLVDFPFPYADGLGDLPGGHLFVIQEEDYLLTDRLRRGFLFHGHSRQSQSHRQKRLETFKSVCACSHKGISCISPHVGKGWDLFWLLSSHNSVLPAIVVPSQKVRNRLFLSFPRRRESSIFGLFWTPASAGVTALRTFCRENA